MQLPSNRIAVLFILVVLIVVLVIGGDVFFSKIYKDGEPEYVDADLVIKRNTTDNSSGDTDGDGLLDWQENLYGSDPNLSDTDGDGTNDGDEITDGRDPTVAGPDDELIRLSSVLNTDFEAEGYTPGTLTDDFSKELFVNYLNLKSQGKINNNTGAEFADNLGYQISSELQPEIVHNKSDLNSIESNDETITKYANDLANMYINYLNQINSLSTLDDEQYLISTSNIYKSLSNSLATMPVPSSALNVHIELVNITYNKGVSLVEFSKYVEDPLQSLLSVKKIREADAREVEVLQALSAYFTDNDIIFTDNEIIRFWNLYE